MYKGLERIAPVILSGGKSKRMGSNKAFVTLGNEKLIEIVVKNISELFAIRPLLVTNTPEDYAYLGLPMVADVIPDMGPLGGIHAALRYSPQGRIFVFGCDMPFVNAELIKYMGALAEEFDVVMPRCDSGRPEPLHAIYAQSCLSAIEACLGRGERRAVAFLPEVNVRYLEEAESRSIVPHDMVFMNINTQADLEKVRKLWQDR